MIFRWEEIYLIVMYCKLPRKLDVSAIQIQALLYWPDFLVRTFWTAIYFYSLEQCLDIVLDFLWDIPQDLKRIKYP